MNRISSSQNSKLKNFCLYLSLSLSAISVLALVMGFVVYDAYDLVDLVFPITLLLFIDLFIYFELILGPHDPNYYPGPVTRNQQYEYLRGMEIMRELEKGRSISDIAQGKNMTQE